MNIRDMLKGLDGKISYYECAELIEKLKESKDTKLFKEILEKESDQKDKLESSLIYLVSNNKEKGFIEKYNKYLVKELENDVRNYLNNKYCLYLLFIAIMNDESDGTDNLEKLFINDKTINKCLDDIEEKEEKLLKKLNNNEELENTDKIFLENAFSFFPSVFVIHKEVEGEEGLISVIVKYFNKYPIKDLTTPRSKQLYILYILSKKLMELPGNCGLSYTLKEQKRGNLIINGFVYTAYDGIPEIAINDLDLYSLDSDIELLEKIFTLFHEVGHIRQNLKLKEYTKEEIELIDLENKIISRRKDFYNKHHADFYIELDADTYAINEIINEYGKTYPKIVKDIVEKRNNTKRMSFDKFYQLELEEYKKIGGEVNKKLIVYFSYTGNTKKIANIIKDKLNCDIVELIPKEPYSKDYQTVVDEEQRLEGSNHLREYKDINVNLDDYDTIIVGTPVWWYRECPVIRTFLTNNDLSNKRIIPFATNAGWLGKTFIEIKKMCPNSKVENEKNIVFESYSDELVTPLNEINEWIKTI